jgi:hypothetical protein
MRPSLLVAPVESGSLAGVVWHEPAASVRSGFTLPGGRAGAVSGSIRCQSYASAPPMPCDRASVCAGN